MGGQARECWLPDRLRYRTAQLKGHLMVRESPIHGLGVFARRHFLPGEYIGTYWGTKARETTPYTLFITHEDGREERIEGRNLLRWLNHSDEPSAGFDGLHLFALREIVPGEEITFDYAAGEGITFPQR